MRHHGWRVVAVALALLLGRVAPVPAQTLRGSFEELEQELTPGRQVEVAGRTVGALRGRLARLTTDVVVLDVNGTEWTFAVDDITLVERPSDPIWDGGVHWGLVGYLSGAAVLSATCGLDMLTCLPGALVSPIAVSSAALLAGAGIAVDALTRPPLRIFVASPVAIRRGGPTAAFQPARVRGGAGLALSFSF